MTQDVQLPPPPPAGLIERTAAKIGEGIDAMINGIISKVGGWLDGATESMRNQDPSGRNLLSEGVGKVTDAVKLSPGGSDAPLVAAKGQEPRSLARAKEITHDGPGGQHHTHSIDPKMAALAAGANAGNAGIPCDHCGHDHLGTMCPPSTPSIGAGRGGMGGLNV